MNRALTLAWLLVALVLPLSAQERDLLAEARRLRDAGELGAARALVEQHVRAFPQDGAALWLLAQLAYWSGDRSSAREAYADALALLPDDPWLRVDAARFHAETGRYATTFRLLTPLAADPRAPAEARVEAEYWLATAAYWQGDIGASHRRVQTLLARSPENERARALLASLSAELRPWTVAGIEARHDSQRLDRLLVTAEGGIFAVPELALRLGAGWERFDAVAAEQQVLHARAGIRSFLPGVRARLHADVGVVQVAEPATDRAAEVALEARRRVSAAADLRASFMRARYDATLASLDTLLTHDVLELSVDAANRPGLAGTVAYRRDMYPDDNAIVAFHGWVLVPVVARIRTGYAFAHSDADSSRWQSVRYEPYYTPAQLSVHTLLAELTVPVRGMAARINGGYAVSAREQAPVRDGSGALHFYERHPTLWHARISADAAFGGVQLRAEAERRVATYYRATRAQLSVVWRPAR